MSLGETLLAWLSRSPTDSDYQEHSADSSDPAQPCEDPPLALLRTVFPHLDSLIPGARVLDYGCGFGRQAIALAEMGAREVVGVDSNLMTLEKARGVAEKSPAVERVVFVSKASDAGPAGFDVVISQNSMEHFRDPQASLNELIAMLGSNGCLLITFGPPWFAPRGSHMHFFTKVPWVNLLFSEKTVMNVRKRYRSDGAQRYEDVESGLNKMTLAKFERLISNADLVPTFVRRDCVKGLSILGSIPVVRELFVNRVSVILKRQARP